MYTHAITAKKNPNIHALRLDVSRDESVQDAHEVVQVIGFVGWIKHIFMIDLFKGENIFL